MLVVRPCALEMRVGHPLCQPESPHRTQKRISKRRHIREHVFEETPGKKSFSVSSSQTFKLPGPILTARLFSRHGGGCGVGVIPPERIPSGPPHPPGLGNEVQVARGGRYLVCGGRGQRRTRWCVATGVACDACPVTRLKILATAWRVLGPVSAAWVPGKSPQPAAGMMTLSH
jgi:hypothetical protein